MRHGSSVKAAVERLDRTAAQVDEPAVAPGDLDGGGVAGGVEHPHDELAGVAEHRRDHGALHRQL